jgi:hypothetical protein
MAKSKPGANLSDDAKALMGAIFGTLGSPTLVFQLVESRPHPRCQAALDELVAAGAVYKENLPTRGDGSHGVSYKSCWDASEFRRYRDLAKFPLNEPIAKATGAA